MASWEQVVLMKKPEVSKLLEKRHILDDDLKQVVHLAEESGKKLFSPGSGEYLAKMRIGKATFYARYVPKDEGYEINSAYVHKVEILEK